MSRQVKFRDGGSLYVGELPQGCKLCARGSKMVLFATGLCDAACFYCPLSADKANRDVVFADETPVSSDADVVYEAESIGAEGAGISGGDPLCQLDRTIRYIRLLKREFGPAFHIHLYTARADAESSVIRPLYDAGLDEIRFHPQDDDWTGVSRALDIGLDVGIEIPVLPDSDEAVCDILLRAEEMGVSFVNLNELEASETNFSALLSRGYRLRDLSGASILGSLETAERILEWASVTLKTLTVHFCSSRFKDSVQMRNRLLRRRERIKRPFEELDDEDPLLIVGVIRAPHGSTLSNKTMERLLTLLTDKFDVPHHLVNIDRRLSRIEIAPWVLLDIVDDIRKEFSYGGALEIGIAYEYPTWDRLQTLFEPV